MKLYIFRHGMTFQTKNNIDYTPQNYLTSPILPEGIPAIESIGRFLKSVKTDVNYTSPVLRCIQTVEIVSEISGKNFLPNDRLTEFATWAETFDKFRNRAKEFISYLGNQKVETVSVCTHGALISALKHLFINNEYDFKDLTDYPLPGIVTIINDNNLEEIDFTEN